MTTEIKQRKPVVQRKRVKPTGNERPEEVRVLCLCDFVLLIYINACFYKGTECSIKENGFWLSDI